MSDAQQVFDPAQIEKDLVKFYNKDRDGSAEWNAAHIAIEGANGRTVLVGQALEMFYGREQAPEASPEPVPEPVQAAPLTWPGYGDPSRPATWIEPPPAPKGFNDQYPVRLDDLINPPPTATDSYVVKANQLLFRCVEMLSDFADALLDSTTTGVELLDVKELHDDINKFLKGKAS